MGYGVMKTITETHEKDVTDFRAERDSILRHAEELREASAAWQVRAMDAEDKVKKQRHTLVCINKLLDCAPDSDAFVNVCDLRHALLWSNGKRMDFEEQNKKITLELESLRAEVERLKAERDRNQASRQWHREKKRQAESERDEERAETKAYRDAYLRVQNELSAECDALAALPARADRALDEETK